MNRAKILTFQEAISWGRKSVWIQLRNMSCSMEMKYALEHAPFLRFRDEKLNMELQVRADYYGKTWRCFEQCPVFEEDYPWEDQEEWVFPDEEADTG